MHAIRQHVVIFAGLILIWLFIGFSPAFWMAIGLVVSIGTNNLTHVVGRAADRRGHNEGTLKLVLFLTVLSFILAVAWAIFIFFWFGWIPALGVLLMFFAYFALKEDSNEKLKREVAKVRSSLAKSLKKGGSGLITPIQLEERFRITLQEDLPEQAYNLDFIYAPLLEKGSFDAAEYQNYLSLIEKYLSAAEKRHFLYSKIHLEVRSLLGLPRRLNGSGA